MFGALATAGSFLPEPEPDYAFLAALLILVIGIAGIICCLLS